MERHTTCNTVANCAAISAWPAGVGSVWACIDIGATMARDGSTDSSCQRAAESGQDGQSAMSGLRGRSCRHNTYARTAVAR